MDPPSSSQEEAIFQIVAALPSGDRAAYLDAACAGRPEVRERIERLLATVDVTEFMQAPRAPLSPELEAQLARLKPEKAGERIGPYKLLQQLGEGGFGVVWMAEQTEPVKRRVALKIIKMGMDTKEVVARFEQERQALAMMDHPNIAKVFDAGATQWGRPFFVMELVRGVAITAYCDEQKLPVRERLALFIDVCHALQHAHQKGIIHRDLKPSNILVTAGDGDAPLPKVIDFGVAKAMDHTLTDLTLFTQFEQMIGTPAYMSPEQTGAGPMDIDTRSDIYSLGVVLYELLTGKPPFDPNDLRKAGHDEMRRVIREEEPPRPSTRLSTLQEMDLTAVATRRHVDAAKLASLVRGDLDWIVMKALEKNRNRRYETANGLAMDLQRHLQNEPVLARPPSTAYVLQKLVRRHRTAVAAGSAVVLALIGGIAVSTWQAVRATHAERAIGEERTKAVNSANAEAIQRRKAEEQTRKAEEQTKKAEAAATQARENLSQSDFFQALRSINEDKTLDALAQLTHSLAANPRNDAALCRLTTLLLQRSFALPVSGVRGHGEVVSAQFSPDGTRIATASRDDTVRVWDAQSGQPLTAPMKHDGLSGAVQFSPDGKRIVTTSGDKTDGKRIVTASYDKTARVWDAQTGEPLTGPLKDDGVVHSAQFSPDGKRIVTASSGKTARVWDAQSGEPLTEPLKHDGAVHAAQFSPDGKRIVTASVDRTARVWDAQSGEPLTGPLQHGYAVWSAEFSPDGKRIVTASWDMTARVWDAQSGEPLTEPLKHDGAVYAAQFSPDGKRIVTAIYNTAWVWDAQSGKRLTAPLKHDGVVRLAKFSPDGKRIVTASSDDTVRVWDAQTGEALTAPLKHASAARFSTNGKRIVTASRDGTVRVWDAQSGEPLTEPLKHDDEVESAQFSPDGKRIVTASKTARVWDAQSGQPLTGPLKHDDVVMAAQFSPDGKRIVTASADRTVRVWDAQNGQPLTEPLKHDYGVYAAQFSPDGKRIVTASLDRTARVWDAQSGQPLTEPLKHDEPVLAAQFSPDGKWIVTASLDRTARVWDAQSGQPLTEPLRHDEMVSAAQFSPDGKRIVTAAVDRTARVWDARSGQPLAGPLKHDGAVYAAQFSPDGKRIVTASYDKTARVWDAQSGEQLTEPLQHYWAVSSARFSPDGKRIVTAAADSTARVWDAQSGQPLTEPLKHNNTVYAAQFSPDGKRIVTASRDGTARVWDFLPRGKAPEWLPRLAEAVAGQHLNDRGVFEPANEDPIRVLEEIRAQLNSAPANDDWTVFGRWFLADRSTRTISPFSKITVPQYIGNRITENTSASLDEAERLAIGNAELLQRIANAREPLEMTKLANSHADAGRWDEALPLWVEASVRLPKDTLLAVRIATLQAWLGKTEDHAASSRRMLALAAGTNDATTFERAAKAYCIGPSSDPQLLESAVTLARRAVDLGKGHQFLPYYQMALGMAEYRNGNYPAADQALTAAEKAAKDNHHVRDPARFFRVMSLFRQGKEAEARQLFAETAEQMKPLPADERLPLANAYGHDDVVIWLACKEAKALLEGKTPAAPAKPDAAR